MLALVVCSNRCCALLAEAGLLLFGEVGVVLKIAQVVELGVQAESFLSPNMVLSVLGGSWPSPGGAALLPSFLVSCTIASVSSLLLQLLVARGRGCG
jgi:hypothetical protein